MTDAALRKQLLTLLAGEGAHMTFEEAVADFPDDAINRRPPNVPYSPWQLLEHVRLTQLDILEYVVNPNYVEGSWPDDYWPAADTTATPKQFAETIRGYLADRQALSDLVADRTRDLVAVMPNTPGHTLLREIRIVADHTAYHVGEFAILRQIMGTWPADPIGALRGSLRGRRMTTDRARAIVRREEQSRERSRRSQR